MEITPREQAEIDALAISTPEWRRRMAMRMAAASASQASVAPAVAVAVRQASLQKKAGWFDWLRLPAWGYAMIATAAVVGVTFAGWWVSRETPLQKTERLLVEAYVEQRTIEFRFGNAPYAPKRIQRGGAADRPAALSDAEATATRELNIHPEDPAWLAARGRVDLLEGDYEKAIDRLQRALEASPVLDDTKVALAAAYFQRAESTQRPEDYGKSFELLSNALRKHPNDAVALFNRAIVAEKIYLVEQAIEDWNAYLQIDGKSDWAADARKRLTILRQKNDELKRQSTPLDHKPVVFLKDPRPGDRSEEYLDLAVREWLPSAFPEEGGGDSEANEALRQLSILFVSKHNDHWLTDLLHTPQSAAYNHGIAELALASQKTAVGEPESARVHAQAAIRYFAATLNHAGVVRARLEELFARDRALQGPGCQEAVRALDKALPPGRYPWIEAQSLLERQGCFGIAGNANPGGHPLESAMRIASAASLGVLQLRIIGFQASARRNRGDLASAWSLDLNGLQTFWTRPFPSMRAYQFYGDLSYCAEHAQQMELAYAVAKASVGQVSKTANSSVEAMARQRAARFAMVTGRLREAEQEFERSQTLFRALPKSDVTGTYQLEGEIDLAQIQIQTGRAEEGGRRLDQARSLAGKISNQKTLRRFFETRASLEENQRNFDSAEADWWSSIAIHERWLKSLNNDADRARWGHDAALAYRSLVQLRWQNRQDPTGALNLWEWYRAAILRSAASGPEQRKPQTQNPPTLNASVKNPMDSMNPEDFKASLAELQDATLLSFVVLPQGVAVFVGDDRSVSASWVERPVKSIPSLAQRFVKLCSDPKSNEQTVHALAQHLYNELLSPGAGHMPSGRMLVIEMDENLAQLPVHALVDPEGRYLGDSARIIYSPGLLFRRHLRSVRAISGLTRALVVGISAVDRTATLTPVADAETEAASVAHRFATATLLTGRQATVEAVMKYLPSAEFFHFAGHSVARADGSGLLLASPQSAAPALLTARELTPAHLRLCRMAVLSACSTQDGQGAGVGDPDSLVRALLVGGVPFVVASRWDVDSATTAAFMDSFYGRLAQGNSGPTALNGAAAAIRAAKEMAHPYYWAAFSGFGSVRQR